MNKSCSKCREVKSMKDFYRNGERIRSECKSCTSSQNSEHQKEQKSWIPRYQKEKEKRASWNKEQYAYLKANESDKLQEYRATYQGNFKKARPNYYKEYYQHQKKGITQWL